MARNHGTVTPHGPGSYIMTNRQIGMIRVDGSESDHNPLNVEGKKEGVLVERELSVNPRLHMWNWRP